MLGFGPARGFAIHAATALAIAWGMVGRAGAQPQEACADFCWEAPPECPDEADVKARIATLGEGRDLPQPRGIVARVTRDAEQWVLVLTQPPERRIIRADDCSDLAEAAAVAVTLSLGSVTSNTAPTGSVSESTEELNAAPNSSEPPRAELLEPTRPAPTLLEPVASEPAPVEPVASEPAPVEPVAPPNEDSPSKAPAQTPSASVDDDPPAGDTNDSGPSVLIGIDALVDGMQLPSAAPGLKVALGVRSPALRMEAYAVALLPVQERIPGATEVDAQFEYFAAGARGCSVLAGAPTWLRICGNVEVGRLNAHASDLLDSREQSSIVPSLGLGAHASPSWQDFELTVGIDAAVALIQDSFTVDEGRTELFEAPAVTIRGSAGVAFFVW